MVRSLLIFLLLSAPLFAQEPYWVPLDGPKGGPVQFLERHPDGRLFVGGTTTLGWTSDLGKTWHLHPIPGGGTLYDITISPDGNLYVCTHLGLYKSTTDGATFERLHNGDARQLHIKPDGTLINVIKPVLGISTDDGATWDYVYSGINTDDDAGYDIFATDDDGGIVMIDYVNGAYRSTDNGASWEHTLQVDGAKDVAYNKGTDTYYAVLRGVSSNSYRTTVWYSNDIGATWDSLLFSRDDLYSVTRLECTEEYTFVYSVRGTEVITLRNHAAVWDTLSFPESLFGDILANGGELIAGAIHGIVYTDDFGATWGNIGEPVQDPFVNGLYTDDYNGIYASTRTWIYRSSDGGVTWRKVVRDSYMTDVAKYQENRVLITTESDTYIYNLINESSEELSLFGDSDQLRSFDVETATNGFVYLATQGHLYRTKDNGRTWELLVDIPYSHEHSSALGINSRDEVFVTTDRSGGVHRSTDYGDTWINYKSFDGEALDMGIDSRDHIYLCTREGTVEKSVDFGETWTVVYNNPGYMDNLCMLPNDDIAIRQGNSIHVSSDHGATWKNLTGNLEGMRIWSLTNDKYGSLYAGTMVNGIYKTAMPVSVGSTPEAAGEFSLEIHPNPVHAGGAAQVRYGMPIAGNGIFTLHDALGRELRRDARHVEPGTHSKSISTAGLPPGVYYYSILADGQKKTEMLVVR